MTDESRSPDSPNPGSVDIFVCESSQPTAQGSELKAHSSQLIHLKTMRDRGIPQRYLDRPYVESEALIEIKAHVQAAYDHLVEAGFALAWMEGHHQSRDEFYAVCEQIDLTREAVAMCMFHARQEGLKLNPSDKPPAPSRRRSSPLVVVTQQQLGLGYDDADAVYEGVDRMTVQLRKLSRENTLLRSQVESQTVRAESVLRQAQDAQARLDEYIDVRTGAAKWVPANENQKLLALSMVKLRNSFTVVCGQLRANLRCAPPVDDLTAGAVRGFLSSLRSEFESAAAMIEFSMGMSDGSQIELESEAASAAWDEHVQPKLDIMSSPDSPNPGKNKVEQAPVLGSDRGSLPVKNKQSNGQSSQPKAHSSKIVDFKPDIEQPNSRTD